jgi:hypothetical protein
VSDAQPTEDRFEWTIAPGDQIDYEGKADDGRAIEGRFDVLTVDRAGVVVIDARYADSFAGAEGQAERLHTFTLPAEPFKRQLPSEGEDTAGAGDDSAG